MFALMELYEIGIQELLYKETEEISIDTCIDKYAMFAEREKESGMKRLVQYFQRLRDIVVYKNRTVRE